MLLSLLSTWVLAAVRVSGQLTLDGLPPGVEQLPASLEPYLTQRFASLAAFDVQGSGILISSRLGDTVQICHVQSPGADRQQLTFFPYGVGGGIYDPKDSSGFFIRMDPLSIERHQYAWWDVKKGESLVVTDGRSANASLLVSPRGGRAIFAAADTERSSQGLFIVDRHDPRTRRQVAQVPGLWQIQDWSADGTQVLIMNQFSIDDVQLYILDVETGRREQVNPLGNQIRVGYSGAAFARHQPGVFFISDEGGEYRHLYFMDDASGRKVDYTPGVPWDVASFAVSLDGKFLAYTINEGGYSALYLGSPTAPGLTRRVSVPAGVVGGLRFDPSSTRLGMSISTPTEYMDVYTLDARSGALTRWTHSETSGLLPSTLVTPELIQYPSFDGRMIPAWYYRPQRKGRAPVVVHYHGGPEIQVTAAYDQLAQAMVRELGAAVIYPNFRGSTGYGRSYAQADNQEKRQDGVKDGQAVLSWIATRPELDAKRVAVYGASYGGYMVLAVMEAEPKRVRCGLDIVGISNLATWTETSEPYYRASRRVELGDETEPRMRRFLEDIAPANHTDLIRAPLLVLHGKSDRRVVFSEAEKVVQGVRRHGGEVWFISAEGEGHGFQKARHREVQWAAVFSFLQRCFRR